VNVKAVPVLLICKACEAGRAPPIWYLKVSEDGVKEMSEAAWRLAPASKTAAVTTKRR
jgi:hypothetical protein